MEVNDLQSLDFRALQHASSNDLDGLGSGTVFA